MTRRYIVIPEAIPLIDPETDEPIDQKITFPQYVRGRTLDPKFGTNIEAIESCLAIRKSIKGKGPGELWEIDQDDWKLLCEIVSNPSLSMPYNPSAAEAISGFSKYVLEATTEKPASFVSKEN